MLKKFVRRGIQLGDGTPKVLPRPPYRVLSKIGISRLGWLLLKHLLHVLELCLLLDLVSLQLMQLIP